MVILSEYLKEHVSDYCVSEIFLPMFPFNVLLELGMSGDTHGYFKAVVSDDIHRIIILGGFIWNYLVRCSGVIG